MPNPVLRVGDTKNAEAVHRVQALLRSNGYWSQPTTDRYTEELEDAVLYFQQTHQGSNGKPLGVDGVIGDSTWWALEHASGDDQRSFIAGKIPFGLSLARTTVLDVALKQHGAKEEPNGSNRGSMIDRFLPDFLLKQPRPGPPWCCFFFSWVSREGFGYYPLKQRIGACVEAVKVAKALGMFFPNDGKYVPRPGDAFVMLYSGDRAGHGHIGYVLRVDPPTGRFNTCEGNCGNRVKVGLRDYDADLRIAGFINFYGDATVASNHELGVIEAPSLGQEATI